MDSFEFFEDKETSEKKLKFFINFQLSEDEIYDGNTFKFDDLKPRLKEDVVMKINIVPQIKSKNSIYIRKRSSGIKTIVF